MTFPTQTPTEEISPTAQVRRKPYTPREVEQCRIVAKDYPEGIRETIRRLVDTIEEKDRRIEELEHDARRAHWGGPW